jgi:hypothetical protein
MKTKHFNLLSFFYFHFQACWNGLACPLIPLWSLCVNLIVDRSYLPAFKVNCWGFYDSFFVYFIVSFLYFLTAFYSPSKSHYLEKWSKFFYLMAFIAPIVIIKTNINFFCFEKTALFFFIGALLLIVYNWFCKWLRNTFFVENIDADVKLPNYMSVSSFIRSFILFFHERKSLFYNMLKLCHFVYYISGIKGAFLFMILIFLLTQD